MPGRMRSRNSTTMTSEPSRRQTEPSSSPMTPAPTTTSFFGTVSSASAPVDETTVFSSISMPGSRGDVRAGGDDDVLASRASGSCRPSPVDLDLARRRRCAPCRETASILFFFSRNATPLTLPSTPSSLNASIVLQVELRLADLDAHGAEVRARPPRTARRRAAAPWRGCSRR